MSDNRFVGSRLARFGAPALGLMTIALALAARSGPRYVFYAAIICGLMTWISLVHAVRPLFKLWMRLAETMHTVAVVVLFSACYLLIVPLFRIIVWRRDPLRLRRKPDESGWVPRSAVVDAASLERMG